MGMSYSTFLQQLGKRGRGKFVVQRDGFIRHRYNNHCPLSFIAGDGVKACSASQSIAATGMDEAVANQVVGAADSSGAKYATERAELLQVLGL